ncbi:hypothetical protein LIER_09803 [Lithospermum erythrorhizon]|uniref:Uncharacterized protein n=1 Tax=Lithospermum erythrorhizon TaxID=34254 RepID=A0AAV3PLY8_LITER
MRTMEGVSSPKNGTFLAEKSCGLSPGRDSYNTRVKVQNLCSDVSLMNINEHEGLLCQDFDNQFSESVTSFRDRKTATSGVKTSILNEKFDPSLHSGLQKSQLVSHEIEDD